MCRDDDTGVDTVELGEGIQYLMKLLDLRGIGEKLMTDLTSYWWILLLALILAMLLSFVWIGQCHSQIISSLGLFTFFIAHKAFLI